MDGDTRMFLRVRETSETVEPASPARERGGPPDMDHQVARRIRQARLRRGLSQSELAREMGLSLQQVHKYETARNRIGAARLVQVAQVLGVEMDWLFDDAGPTTGDGQDSGSRECLELVRNFHRIPDREQRAAFLSMLRAMAAWESDATG